MSRLSPTSPMLPAVVSREEPGVPGVSPGVAGACVGVSETSAGWVSALTLVWSKWWLLALGSMHLGYILLGKGFANLPYPPLFVGELVLVAGVPVVLLCRRWRALLSMPTVVLIMGLFVWGMVRTLPYVGAYGVDAIRDAAIFYYASFVLLITAVLIDQPQWLPRIVRVFDRWGWRLILPLPFIFLSQMALGESMPNWPGLGTPICRLKAGDPLVFVGAMIAMTIVGLGRTRSLWWYLPLAVAVATHGAISRGGLMAFCLAFGIAFAFYPKSSWPWRLIVVSLVLITALIAIDPVIKMPGRDREFSIQQIALNITSTFSGATDGDLDDTKTWRLQWWGKIIDYTFHGDYFWAGKGFGVNLADSDGFQIDPEHHTLRSPHNGHLNILARAGVPGFSLWMAMHASWCLGMGMAYLRCRARRLAHWQRYFIWLGAAYVATVFHASFDVYLENPMGGIWLWSIMGLGLAGVYLAPRFPTLLDGVKEVPSNSNRGWGADV